MSLLVESAAMKKRVALDIPYESWHDERMYDAYPSSIAS